MAYQEEEQGMNEREIGFEQDAERAAWEREEDRERGEQDYVTCVRQSHADALNKTWCGKEAAVQFYFSDIDQAAYNALQGGRLVICPECAAAIIAALSLNAE